jgi:3-hydroxyisobutyrate dehydrogenase-like beta-hydroxyacid dehydrogenase
MKKDENIQQKVTIVGLGQMGIKLAELLRDQSISVTVWNRSIAKANAIKNVQVIANLNSAIDQSAIIIICVYDYNAINEILSGPEIEAALKGKTIINLTTGSPQEAENLNAQIIGYGAHYLDGAIQVAPDQMGMPDTTILISGDQQVYNEQETLLKFFGGNIKYLGSKATAASAMDLATLTWLYGSYIGLMYGAGLAKGAGLNLSVYSDILAEITPGFTSFFQHQLQVIETGNYAISQSPLAISVAATQRIWDAVKDSGMDTKFPENMALLLKKAEVSGYGEQELAALIKVVQKKEDDNSLFHKKS